MKLINVVIVFDTYVVADGPGPASLDSARGAVLHAMRSGDLEALTVSAYAVNHAPIRGAAHNQKALVAEDVSDADFAKIKGKTTQQVHDLLFLKKHEGEL